jgi:hypothetical protein
MFWAKATQHTYLTIVEPAYRAYSQNQTNATAAIHLKNGATTDNDNNTPPHFIAHTSRTSTDSVVVVVADEEEKMSRSNNNGKRHKNHAGHKASKHRKNNKGNKANNNSGSGGGGSSHHQAAHRRINRAISRPDGQGWYAVASMQGHRPHMEDAYSVVIPDTAGPTGPTGGDLHSLFGVFDGHGGKVRLLRSFHSSSPLSLFSFRTQRTCPRNTDAALRSLLSSLESGALSQGQSVAGHRGGLRRGKGGRQG